MNAAQQPLLIADPELAPQQHTPEPELPTQATPTQQTTWAACRLIDALRLPGTSWDRDRAIHGALDQLTKAVGAVREEQPPRTATTDDSRWVLHYIAAGELIETVDSERYVALRQTEAAASRFLWALNRTGTQNLDDDITQTALAALRADVDRCEARTQQLARLRGEANQEADL